MSAAPIRFNPMVSWVASGKSTATATENAVDLLNRFRSNRPDILVIRENFLKAYDNAFASTGDLHRSFAAAKSSVSELKLKLPAVMWSGQFSRRSKDGLDLHSGLLVADLDELQPDVLKKARGQLTQDPHVWGLFTSPTGSGLKVVFRVPADADRHGDSFRAVLAHVLQVCGLDIDKSGKDVARLCFITYDPEAYLNESAVELEPAAPTRPTPRALPASSGGGSRKDIACAQLGPIEWEDDHSGFCHCPGIDLHTSGNARKDCRVMLDEAPTVHCVHSSCRGAVEQANLALRSAIGKAEFRPQGGRGSTVPPPAAGPAEGDLVKRFGAPFFTDEKGTLTSLNESYWAGDYARENVILFEPDEKQFYRYDPSTGIYSLESCDAIKDAVSTRLLHASRSMGGASALERKRTANTLANIVQHLKGQAECRGAFVRNENRIHVSNGVIVFNGNRFDLLPFSPNFRARNASPITYNPDAECDRFLNELVRPAVHPEDVELIQKFFGMALLGDNRLQRILILDGEGGRGKSQLANVLQLLVGMPNVTQLRTRHLGDRFETFRFRTKTLLVGADVEPDFLSTRGAAVLKQLVGGDWIDAEQKGGTGSFQMQGRFNVLIVSNARLRVSLEGDASAWRRRLTIVRYEGPSPRVKVPDFGRVLINAEGSGILNWALEGARLLLAEAPDAGGDLRLTQRQNAVVDSLLAESESLKHFIIDRVTRAPGRDVTGNELLEAYAAYCPERGWRALPVTQFHGSVEALMLELFGVGKRNDVKRQGKSQRGFGGVAIISDGSDGSDGSNQVEQEPAAWGESDFSDGSDGVNEVEQELTAGEIEFTDGSDGLKISTRVKGGGWGDMCV